MTFPQDITEICNEFPQRKKSILTFVCYLWNKLTEEVFVKQLKVRKEYVIPALKWLQRHHTRYTDMTIIEEIVDWMSDENKCNIINKMGTHLNPGKKEC